MNNSFDFDDICQLKDEKCLQNTDHTTGNIFEGSNNNVHNDNKFGLSDLSNQYQGLIHFDDQIGCLNNDQHQPQVLELIEDEFQQDIQSQRQNQVKKFVEAKQQLELPQIQEKTVKIIQDQPLKCFSKIQNNSQMTLQLTSDYKIQKKWKQKLKNILEEKCINQFSAKHNRNMAKFFIRLFSKYAKLNNLSQSFSNEVQQKLLQISQKKCISLKDLENLFGGQTSRSSRQFLATILRTYLIKQVIKSQDVQNKAAYLLCSKVYSLRCRSRHLIGRLQSR